MNPDSITPAPDSARWPAWNESNADELLANPITPKAVVNVIVLLKVGKGVDEAISSVAALIAYEHNGSTGRWNTTRSNIEGSIRKILRNYEVIA